MSCYPHDIDSSEPELIKAAKLLRYAKFAVRFNNPDLKEDKKREQQAKGRHSNKPVPRYMKPSKAAERRREENKRRLDIILGKQGESKEENKRRLADKIAAAEAELQKLKMKEAELNKTSMFEDIVGGGSGGKAAAAAETVHFSSDIPSSSLTMPELASPIKAMRDTASSRETSRESSTENAPKLTGDCRSFTFKREAINIHKLSAKRCFRVLTYRDLPNGRREVMDIPDGRIYFCKTGPQNRRITPDGVAFDTRDLAMAERFPANQVGAARSGNGTLPRILVAFDCWGKASRRMGGGGAARYQYCKFSKIISFLDAPKTTSKKQAEHPVVPNYYPKADHRPAPRSPIDKAIYLDKMFNTRVWDKPSDPRPFTPEFKLDSLKPAVPSYKVPRRKERD